ncbi:MAG: biotin--[acetyl-CoA-carboxylase] ligase [Gammaproteobacteria bacterium]|nr:MAG: biotin--[acetyl-CoA-carboxylase] ligase [Gammaproteobacteria bacterium]
MIKKANANLIKIVDILNDGDYHDGETIGKKLKMTRSAVWKAIKKLEGYQIAIDSVKGKGYALLQPLILLEASKIKHHLVNEKLDIAIFESIDSTNDYLKAFKNSQAIKICLAEQQTRGKARLGREWYSPFGENIYFSCLYPFQKDVSELAGLSLVTSLAVLKTFKEIGVKEKLFVKWPNDILCDNKKLSGSLIEIQAETHGVSSAIIGIGMNVNMIQDDAQISQAWTSVQKILGCYVDRNEVCAKLINHLIAYWQQFDAQGFAPFIEEWMASDCLMQQAITLNNLDKKIKGKVVGINEQGHLLLKLTDGSVRAFSSGDTTIAKRVG